MIKGLFKLCATALLCAACVTTPSAEWGVQPDHRGFVPARIAVLGCQAWPASTRFESLPLTSAKPAEIAALCQKLDAFVLDGFKDQPFMKGLSPAGVQKLLAKGGKVAAPADLTKLWPHKADDCRECAHAATFYAASIGPRPEWRAWLGELSRLAAGSDAVLLPLVLYAYESRENDRGLMIARRAAGVGLLLVGTDSGDLLWAGKRDADITNQRLEQTDAAGTLEVPGWEGLTPRLLAEDIWRDFPGRQIRN